MELISEVIGWIGALFIISAYFGVSYKKISPVSKTYQIMNLVGAIGVGINAFQQAAWPSFGIQMVWFAVAFIAMINIIRHRL